MAAPKGNKFAVKENPKTVSITFNARPEVKEKLKKFALKEKVTLTQIIEKSLLASYPKDLDGLF